MEDTAQDDSDGEDSEVPLRQHSLLLVVQSRRTTDIRKARGFQQTSSSPSATSSGGKGASVARDER